MEPGLKEAANWGTDCLNTWTSALNEGGPAAMLDAASGILENLTAGVVQKIPAGIGSNSGHHQAGSIWLTIRTRSSMIQMLEQLIIGITDNLPLPHHSSSGIDCKVLCRADLPSARPSGTVVRPF